MKHRVYKFVSFKSCMGRTFSSTDTSFTVFSVLVSEGEFTQITSDHIEFDFNNIEGFSIVNGDVVADHIRHNDSISEMGLDWSWFLAGLGIFLSFLTLEVEPVISVLDFTSKTTSLTSSK